MNDATDSPWNEEDQHEVEDWVREWSRHLDTAEPWIAALSKDILDALAPRVAIRERAARAEALRDFVKWCYEHNAPREVCIEALARAREYDQGEIERGDR